MISWSLVLNCSRQFMVKTSNISILRATYCCWDIKCCFHLTVYHNRWERLWDCLIRSYAFTPAATLLLLATLIPCSRWGDTTHTTHLLQGSHQTAPMLLWLVMRGLWWVSSGNYTIMFWEVSVYSLFTDSADGVLSDTTVSGALLTADNTDWPMAKMCAGGGGSGYQGSLQ